MDPQIVRTWICRYKGYVGAFHYFDGIRAYEGRVTNCADTIAFQSETREGLNLEMENSVDEYLRLCEERGLPVALPVGV